MKKRLFLLVLTVVLSLPFAAIPAFSQQTALTPDNPFKVDTKEHSVSILASFNGKHPEPTHHGVVFKGGKLYRKAFFIGLVDPKTFHESLASVGFKPGNNMTTDNMERTFVKGDLLDVSVSWKGAKRVYRMDELIRDSNGKPLAIRFGGNLTMALKKNTGCLVCLDSCPVGITSNAAYTYGAIDIRKEVSFTGNKDILPPDGTFVIITFKAKK